MVVQPGPLQPASGPRVFRRAGAPGSALTGLSRLSGRPGAERRLPGPALLHVQVPSEDSGQEERRAPWGQEEEGTEAALS